MNKFVAFILALISFPALAHYNSMYLTGKNEICLLTRDQIEIRADGKVNTVAEDLFRPFGLDILPGGNLLVADSGNSTIKILDDKGQLVSSFGGKGNSDSSLLRPLGVFCDEAGRIVVSDTGNNCIKVFDKEGSFLFKFGKRGYGDSDFLNPFHIFKGSNNSIFVTDPGNICVKRYSKDAFLVKFSEKLLSVSDAALHPDGSIYICDFLDRSVKIYAADGKFKNYYKNRFYYNRPTLIAINKQGDIAVNDDEKGTVELNSAGKEITFKTEGHRDLWAYKIFAAAAGKDGEVYCTDFSGDFYMKVSKDGISAAFGGHGTGPGLFCGAKGIGLDAKGNIYVSDSFNGRIESFDAGGKFLSDFKGFDWPLQLAVGPDDAVYVSETGRNLIRKLDTAGKTLQEIKPGEYFNPGPLAVDAVLNIGVINTLNKSFIMLDPSGKALMSFSFESKWPVSVAAGTEGNFYVYDALESAVFALNKGGLVAKAKLDLQSQRRQKYGAPS